MDNYILKKKDFKLPSNLTNLINDLNPLITITLNYRRDIFYQIFTPGRNSPPPPFS